MVAPARAEEADHAIHEELRAVLREVVTAMNTGKFDDMLPYLADNIAATSMTQEVMSNRADVSHYFEEWFGPTGYMRSMQMKLDADALTELARHEPPGCASAVDVCAEAQIPEPAPAARALARALRPAREPRDRRRGGAVDSGGEHCRVGPAGYTSLPADPAVAVREDGAQRHRRHARARIRPGKP